VKCDCSQTTNNILSPQTTAAYCRCQIRNRDKSPTIGSQPHCQSKLYYLTSVIKKRLGFISKSLTAEFFNALRRREPNDTMKPAGRTSISWRSAFGWQCAVDQTVRGYAHLEMAVPPHHLTGHFVLLIVVRVAQVWDNVAVQYSIFG